MRALEPIVYNIVVNKLYLGAPFPVLQLGAFLVVVLFVALTFVSPKIISKLKQSAQLQKQI